MREGLRHDPALRAALNAVVTDGRCCSQAFLHIAWLKEAAAARRIAPHACQAIGLQLLLHGLCVGFDPAEAGAARQRP